MNLISYFHTSCTEIIHTYKYFIQTKKGNNRILINANYKLYMDYHTDTLQKAIHIPVHYLYFVYRATLDRHRI